MSDRQRIILQAALRLVRSYGTHKTTVADIAREAHVGVGTVYLEFTSKDALFGALSRQVHARVLALVEQELQRRGRLALRLRRAFDARFEAFAATTEARHGLDLVHCARCASIGKAHAAFLEREQALLAAAIAEKSGGGLAAALQRAYIAFVPPLLTRTNIASLREALPAHHDLVLARFDA